MGIPCEIVTLSLTLKTAHRDGYITQVPDLSDLYRRQTKVSHRPRFTPKEYKQLYEATRKNAANPKSPRFKWYAEQLHDFVLFMANTGLRPDEVNLLEFRDIEIITDEWSGERILEIEVRGKRGLGYCKSMLGACATAHGQRTMESAPLSPQINSSPMNSKKCSTAF